MIGITSKSVYGLIIVLELAKNYGKKLIKIDELAETKRIPRSYLVQILNHLKRFQIIESIRGNKGGYKLIDKPSKITIFQVIDKLEDGLRLFDGYEKKDALKNIFNDTMAKLISNLNISLSDILIEQEKLDKEVMYFI